MAGPGFGNNLPPFYSVYGPASATGPGFLTTGAQTVGKSGTMTWQMTAQASTAEAIMAWKVTDDAVAKATLGNATTADNTFIPGLIFTGSGANIALVQRALITTDTGSNAAQYFDVQKAAGGAVVVRPAYQWANNNAVLTTITAAGLLDNAGTIRATGNPVPATGTGAEMYFAGGIAFYSGVNRTAGLYVPVNYLGSTLTFTTGTGGTVNNIVCTSTLNTLAVPEKLASYTVATLPAASVGAGALVYASDAGGNGPCIAMSNGTVWKRCDNTATVVA